LGIGGDCQACPTGMITNGTYCEPCTSSFSYYDISYFTFWMLAIFFINILPTYSLNIDLQKRSMSILYICVLFEAGLAVVFSLLSIEPIGTFRFTVCPFDHIDDWYTIFDQYQTYSGTVYCNTSAVYPRLTLVNLFFTYSIGLLLFLRLPLNLYLFGFETSSVIYGPAYFLPFGILIHFLFGGTVYYTFPYVLIFFCLLFNIFPLAKDGWKSLIRVRSGTFFVIRYLLVAFAMVSFWFWAGIDDPLPVSLVSLLSPAIPIALYFLTLRFTEPRDFLID